MTSVLAGGAGLLEALWQERPTLFFPSRQSESMVLETAENVNNGNPSPLEALLAGAEGFPPMLDIPPDADDETMVELAIALSLQQDQQGEARGWRAPVWAPPSFGPASASRGAQPQQYGGNGRLALGRARGGAAAVNPQCLYPPPP